MQIKTIKANEWKNLLDEFSSAVSQKKYKKVPYNVWRSLNQPSLLSVKIEYNDIDTICVKLFLSEACGTSIFEHDDNSFGQFLYKHYFQSSTIYNLMQDCLKLNCLEVEKIDNNQIYIADSSNWIPIKDPGNQLYTGTSDFGLATATETEALNKTVENLTDKFIELSNKFTELSEINNNNNNNKEKENKTMKFNFDFGTCEGHNIRMSMYGLAVQNVDNTWVSYNPNTNEIVDVDVFSFNGAKYLYKMPVAIKDVAVGDMIIHSRVPMYVSAISADQKTITAIDVHAGETKTIMLARSPFGFNFVTKVVNLFDGMLADNAPSEVNPFGNMWMFMMMSDDKDMKDMLPFMLMAQGNNVMSNPMMMYMLMNDKDENKDMLLPLMMMMNQSKANSYIPAVSEMDNAALDTAPAAAAI